jgi:hypothetical protein
MMNITIQDEVVRLAFDPSINRAVQSLPQHQPIQSDNRFDDLLSLFRNLNAKALRCMSLKDILPPPARRIRSSPHHLSIVRP